MKKENKNFYFGLTLGFAVVSFLAFVFMTFAYINKPIERLISENESRTAKTQANKPAPAPSVPTAQNPVQNNNPIDVKVNENDYFRGDKNAPVTIVEFSDPQCPYCARFHETMKQVMDVYPNTVKWVYKHFPLPSIHPFAKKASEALECAGEQDTFWEYADEMYANQSKINDSYFLTLAKELNLDTTQFSICLDAGKYAKKVSDDTAYGQELGVRGTPGNFVNGISVPGAVSFESIKKIIDSQIK